MEVNSKQANKAKHHSRQIRTRTHAQKASWTRGDAFGDDAHSYRSTCRRSSAACVMEEEAQ